jgi:predicted Rossmann-fold nucleotide-binding protein
MADFLRLFDERQVVAIMGGHAMRRTDPEYRKVVVISKTLTEKGKLMASGGGPGAMEATHLGAWMAGRTPEELDEALSMLEVAPTFRDEGWLRTAFEVKQKFPQNRFRSLGIPTWFYGHEPATPFATNIAKYFLNSIREDTLLTIAKGGIIYTPGSAGTLQEIFQDAAQNHYKTTGVSSPMVFLGVDFFSREVPVYPLLQTLMENGRYKDLLLTITDSEEEAVESIMSFA